MKTPVVVWSHYLLNPRAKRSCPCDCPLAIAIEDQTGIPVQVLGGVAVLEMPNGSRRAVTLPKEAEAFVRQWDTFGVGSTPFAFWLDTEAIADGWEFAPVGRVECEAPRL